MSRKAIHVSALLLSAVLLAACGETQKPSEESQSVKPTDTEAVTEKTYLDALPGDLNFNGQKVRMYTSQSVSLSVNETTGEAINDALFKRNSSVEERLNLEIEEKKYEGTAPWDDIVPNISASVMAGDDDYDLINGCNWYVSPLVFGGYLYDLSDAPYLDLTKPYWAGNYIHGMSYQNRTYFLTGPIELGYISEAVCVFANKRLWNDLYEGESVHTMVKDGTWTLDRLKGYVTDVYQDLNGSTQVDRDDRFGFLVASDFTIERMAYGCGIEVAPFDEDGVPYLEFIEKPDKLISFWEKWYAIKNSGKVFSVQWDAETCQNTADERLRIFSNGNTLFVCDMLKGSQGILRNMTDDYAILPLPKLDENQENYINVISDQIMMYCVPKNVTTEGLSAACALLEAASAESYQTVFPAYFEDALKNKYIRDMESVDTINMLAQNPICDFGGEYLDLGFSTFVRYTIGDNEVASAIASNKKAFQKKLSTLLEKLSSEAEES